MKLLLRGTDLIGLPVVTLDGDDIAEVRDVLFDPQAGQVLGFTLNERGRLAGRRFEVLTTNRSTRSGQRQSWCGLTSG